MAYRIEEGAHEFPLRTDVYQSNPLINARKAFDLMGMRIFILGLRGLNPHFSKKDKFFDENFKETFIPASELTQLFRNTKYLSEMKTACRKLFNTTIEIKKPDGELALTHIFKKLEYNSSKGLHLKFDDEMRPYILNLFESNGYTRINADYLFKLSSPYAVRLLELLLQYQNIKSFRETKEVHRKFTLDELRYLLNVPETAYKNRPDNFKRYVLDTPIREITDRTPYKIHYKVIKTGRRVYAIEFLLDTFDAPVEILKSHRTHFSNDAVTALCQLGFSEKVAQELFLKCADIDDCYSRINRAQAILNRQKKPIENKLGFLRRAIEQDWQVNIHKPSRKDYSQYYSPSQKPSFGKKDPESVSSISDILGIAQKEIPEIPSKKPKSTLEFAREMLEKDAERRRLYSSNTKNPPPTEKVIPIKKEPAPEKKEYVSGEIWDELDEMLTPEERESRHSIYDYLDRKLDEESAKREKEMCDESFRKNIKERQEEEQARREEQARQEEQERREEEVRQEEQAWSESTETSAKEDIFIKDLLNDYREMLSDITIMEKTMLRIVANWIEWETLNPSKLLPSKAIKELDSVITCLDNLVSPTAKFLVRNSAYKAVTESPRRKLSKLLTSMSNHREEALVLKKEDKEPAAITRGKKVDILIKIMEDSFSTNTDKQLRILADTTDEIPEELILYLEGSDDSNSKSLDSLGISSIGNVVSGIKFLASKKNESTKKDSEEESVRGYDADPKTNNYAVFLAMNHYKYYSEEEATPERIEAFAKEITKLFSVIDTFYNKIVTICHSRRVKDDDNFYPVLTPKNIFLKSPYVERECITYGIIPYNLNIMKNGDNCGQIPERYEALFLKSLKKNFHMSYIDFLKLCIDKLIDSPPPETFEIPDL